MQDPMTAAIKALITQGKKRGYVTYDEFHALLPPDQAWAELIEDTMAMLNECEINVVEVTEGGRGAASSK